MVSAVPKGNSTNAKKPVSLEVYADDKTHGIKHSVLVCPTLIVETLNNMFLETKMVHLYKNFVLYGSILLSMHWRDTCAMHDDVKEANGTWNDRVLASVMEEYKNQVLSSEHPFVTFVGASRIQTI